MTQDSIVLNHLKDKSITSMEAIKEYGITRLSAVVCRLRKGGYNIVGESIPVTNRFGRVVYVTRYTLEDK